MFYVAIGLILRRRPPAAVAVEPARARAGTSQFLRGLLTNLLNPKVGVFYLSFLPQFVPSGVQVASFVFLLALLHALLGALWFAALIAATSPLSLFLQRPAVQRWLDHLTALVFIGFGLRLIASQRG